MANFCTKCGTPLTGRFCVKCGADISQSTTPVPPQPVQQNAGTAVPKAVPAPVGGPAFATVPPLVPNNLVTNKRMSLLAKLGIAAVVVVFVGGALAVGGLYYAAHRISQKIHEEAESMLGSSSGSASPGSSSGRTISGNPGGIDVCRLLSKEDVGRAVGLVVVRTQPGDNSCSYIAKGDKADMLAKHATAMMAARGADKQTQQTIQNFAGGMFKAFQSEQPTSEQDTSGEVPVFSFSVDQKAAEEQMRLNAKVLGVMGDQEGLPGIGDQAFVSADGIIMMRKGKNFVRIMFIACPCNTNAVKPLAKEIADAL
jgi:hypothetical protein